MSDYTENFPALIQAPPNNRERHETKPGKWIVATYDEGKAFYRTADGTWGTVNEAFHISKVDALRIAQQLSVLFTKTGVECFKPRPNKNGKMGKAHTFYKGEKVDGYDDSD